MTNRCTWCNEPMGKEKNKSASGNHIHQRCQQHFKEFFMDRKDLVNYIKQLETKNGELHRSNIALKGIITKQKKYIEGLKEYDC